MRKGIALLTAVGMLAGMIVPVSAEDQIITYKGEQEIILTEAGAADLTLEDLFEKTKTAVENTDDLALFMKMDIDAAITADMEGTPMSMDMAIRGDMSQSKHNGVEYNVEKMLMSFSGMNMDSTSEEYVFTNAGGTKVSVKKDRSADSEEGSAEETADTWVAEAVVESGDDTDLDIGTESMSSFASEDLYSLFELLDTMYTDGEKNYYVLKGNVSDILAEAFSDLEMMFGEVDVDAPCYLLLAEDGMLESLYMDLGQIQGIKDEENGTETSFSKFLISVYTEESSEIVIPYEVQAAGDAVA